MRNRFGRLVASAATAAVVFCLFVFLAPLRPPLLNLGFDPQRTQIIIGVTAAGAAAAMAAVIGASITFAWAVTTGWYAVISVVPAAVGDGPATLPGETVAAAPFAIAIAALIAIGCVAAGVGACAGFGLRVIAVRAWAARSSRSRTATAEALAAILLVALSAFGIGRLVAVLTYGPWSGVVVASKPDTPGRATYLRLLELPPSA